MKSAKLQNVEAQNYVGYCYHEGLGVSANLNKAIIWYRKAAIKGNEVAMYNLALCYQERHQKSDFKKTLYWLKKAAHKNYHLAVRMLKTFK